MSQGVWVSLQILFGIVIVSVPTIGYAVWLGRREDAETRRKTSEQSQK